MFLSLSHTFSVFYCNQYYSDDDEDDEEEEEEEEDSDDDEPLVKKAKVDFKPQILGHLKVRTYSHTHSYSHTYTHTSRRKEKLSSSRNSWVT
jgi:hypothetical protein